MDSNEHVTLLRAEELQRSEGIGSQLFPKKYHVMFSKGFYAYVTLLAAIVLYMTVVHPYILLGGLDLFLVVFDSVYFGSLFLFMFFQLPLSVVRERDRLVLHFRCRKRAVPIEEIEEIRIVHSLDCGSQMNTCSRCRWVWGFPTRMDKTVFVFTRSFCTNYQIGLADMEEFLRDNRPAEVDGKPTVLGASQVTESTAPITDVYSFADPRQSAEKSIGIVAFYFPGHDEAWDRACRSGFLGNYFLQPVGEEIRLTPPGYPNSTHTFKTAEAAFLALKFWSQAGEFEGLSGEDAFKLRSKLSGKEDLTYAGFGSNWAAMLAVLRNKFRKGTSCADGLAQTGDAFLLEHNSVSGRDAVWSDNNIGDGKNWLGLQLMLVRDECNNIQYTASMPKSWTAFASSLMDIGKGTARSNDLAKAWQTVVSNATNAVLDKTLQEV